MSTVSLTLAACSLTAPAVIPLAAAAPHTILVLPAVVGPEAAASSRVLLATIGPVLRQRGYRVLSVEDGLAELAKRGVTPDARASIEQCAAVARALGADAVLSLRVEQWDAVFARALVHLGHDIGYRLWDVDSGDLLWELRSHDIQGWSGQPAVVFDSSLESYLGASEVRQRQFPFRSEREAALAIHRRALGRLPRGPLD